MGSVDFCNLVAIAEIKEAFRSIRESEGYERGHSYSGSIAQKYDYTVITRDAMLPDEAEELAYKLIQAGDRRIDDSGGPAGAIPVSLPTRVERFLGMKGRKDQIKEMVIEDLKARKVLTKGESVVSVSLTSYSAPSNYRYSTVEMITDGSGTAKILRADAPSTREVKVTLVVTESEPEERLRKVNQLVRERVKLQGKERISKVAFAEWAFGKNIPDVTFTHKAEIETPEGKAETRYVIEGEREHGKWENGFTSMALARAYIAKAIKAQGAGFTQGETRKYEVVGIIKRSSGAALIRGTRKVAKATVRATVTIIKDNRVTPTIDGWLFFGFASS